MYVNQNVDKYNRKTEKYIVAYLDLLGITNRIQSAEQQELVMNPMLKSTFHATYHSCIFQKSKTIARGYRDIINT